MARQKEGESEETRIREYVRKLRGDAKVEFISSDEIKNLGHVVALLRYK